MKEINTQKGIFYFILVPDDADATDFHYDSWFTRYVNHSKGSIKLDVNTEIISTTKDITEEQIKNILNDIKLKLFSNDIVFEALLEMYGLDINKNYIILRKL